MKSISFRLTDAEHAAIETAAAHAFLPISAFLRKLALEYARDNGLLKSSSEPVAVPVSDILPQLNFDS